MICKNCGGNLPNPAPGSSQRCTFCGFEYAGPPLPVSSFGGAPYLPPGQPMYVAPQISPRIRLLYMLMPFTLIFVVVGINIWSTTMTKQRVADAERQAQIAAQKSKPTPPVATTPTLTLRNLAAAPPDYPEVIDAPGHVGSFNAFDPVANFDWAKKVATAWRPDARFKSLDVYSVARDGLVDFTASLDARVSYAFFSPACIKEYDNSTATVDPKMKCEFEVQVVRNKSSASDPLSKSVDVKVSASGSSLSSMKDSREAKRPLCTLAQAFAALDRGGKLPARPLYNVGYYELGNTWGTRWMIRQVISGQASIPHVDSQTCAIVR